MTWKKSEIPQQAILVPCLLGIILDTPDMLLEKFLSIATKMIREECIKICLERPTGKTNT